jgi:hypothetical protein
MPRRPAGHGHDLSGVEFVLGLAVALDLSMLYADLPA